MKSNFLPTVFNASENLASENGALKGAWEQAIVSYESYVGLAAHYASEKMLDRAWGNKRGVGVV